MQTTFIAPSWFETIRLLTKPNLLTMRELGGTLDVDTPDMRGE